MTDHQAFLGQILMNNDIYYKALPRPWWFVDPMDKAVFNAIEGALSSSLTADIVTVGMKVDSVYVSSLTTGLPTTANWKYYAGRCKTAGAKNELRGLTHIITDGLENRKASELIEDINNTIEKIVSGSAEYKIQAVKELMVPMVDELEARYKSRGDLPGLQTGFELLDNVIGGLQKSKMYVLGARPSQGKSAMALNMAGFISQHHSVGFLSLESSWREMLIRELSSETGINSQRLASGFFSESDFGGLIDASGRIANKRFYIYDKPNCSLVEIIGQCRRMVNRFKAEVLFIDYLQLVQTDAISDRERVSHVSKRLKDLARELKVPIVALAQLRRDSEGRRPGLGDFQHSSQIEQDADVGMMLYHTVYSKDNDKNLHKSIVEDENTEYLKIFLLVDKNRDGRTGAVPMRFKAETVTFKEVIE